MLYNVILGDHRNLPDRWQLIKEGDFYFYEKADLHQRIRLSQDFGTPQDLQYLWGTDTIQCYEFEEDPEHPKKRWRNNTSNMNPIFRILDPKFKDQSEQIVVYVTVMKNYKIVDFRTDYQILSTYHKKGYYQGCALVLTRKQLERNKNRILLTLNVYDRKKDVAKEITVEFKDLVDTHLQVKFTNIKEPATLEWIMNRIEHSKFAGEESLLGFKCIVKPGSFLTSVYFVAENQLPYVEEHVRIYNKDIVPISDELLKNPEELLKVVRAHTEKNHTKVRAITQVGIRLPLQVIKGAHIIYVFNMGAVEENLPYLECIKSN